MFFKRHDVVVLIIFNYVTRVRQLGSDSLKARRVVITTLAHMQTFDRCVLKLSL